MTLVFDPDLDMFSARPDLIITTANCVGVAHTHTTRALAERFPLAARRFVQLCGRHLDCEGRPDERFSGRNGSEIPPCLVSGTPCKTHRMRPGITGLTKTDTAGPDWLAHLPTRLHWRDGADIEMLDLALEDLARRLSGQTKRYLIHIPEMDAAESDPPWRDVQPLLEYHLGGAACQKHDIRCHRP